MSFHRNTPIVGIAGLVLLVLALANLFSGLFTRNFSIRRPLFAVLTVLVAVLTANAFLPKFFQYDPSGRTIARELAAHGIPGNQLFVAGMNRSLRYGVSFYLREEIRDWGPSMQSGGYLLVGGKNCEQVTGTGFYCEEQIFDTQHETGRFLYLVIPIAEEKVRR